MQIPIRNNLVPELKLKVYKRPGDIVKRFLEGMELLDGKYSFLHMDVDEKFFTKTITPKEFVHTIKRQGHWEFMDRKTKEIFLWVDGDVIYHQETMINALAHELSHAFWEFFVQGYAECNTSDEAYLYEEASCNTVADISLLAIGLYERLLEQAGL